MQQWHKNRSQRGFIRVVYIRHTERSSHLRPRETYHRSIYKAAYFSSPHHRCRPWGFMESHWYSIHMGRLKKLDFDVSVECSRTSRSRVDVHKNEWRWTGKRRFFPECLHLGHYCQKMLPTWEKGMSSHLILPVNSFTEQPRAMSLSVSKVDNQVYPTLLLLLLLLQQADSSFFSNYQVLSGHRMPRFMSQLPAILMK